MSRPVVVYVLRRYPQLSQTFVRNEVHALRDAGVDVRVITLSPPDDTVVNSVWAGPVSGLPVVSSFAAVRHLVWWALHRPSGFVSFASAAMRMEGRPSGLVWRYAPALARSLHGQRVTALHTHFAWEGLLVAVLMARLLGVPSSATVHARDIYLPGEHVPRRLAALDRLVTVCRYNVDYLHSLGWWRGAVDVVPCGVEVPEGPATINPASQRVVTVARLVEKKGVLVLLEAVALVRQRLPGVVLDIVGDGPQRSEVRAAVQRLGLGDCVRLLGDLDHDSSLAVIDGASVFALACQVDSEGDSDALPVVLREAMVRAKPVVTTAVAGIPEIVDAKTGWLADERDPESLAEALLEALTNVEEAHLRGRAARERTLASGMLADTAAGMRRAFGLPELDASSSESRR